MIPEKWDKIYLYASIIEEENLLEKGEMFFYYYPKGILKKNPVNVYEIPSKFNIDEKSYMKLVDGIYATIKSLRKEFEKSGEKVWTNVTISIANLKFYVEYDYEDLQTSDYSNYDRHIIWQYKYLDMPIDRLSKRDKKMLETYLLQEQFKNKEIKKHTENMYQKNIHNIVEYNREENDIKAESLYKEEGKEQKQEEKKLDKYELYKRKQQEQKKRENQIVYEQKEKNRKNQILNF